MLSLFDDSFIFLIKQQKVVTGPRVKLRCVKTQIGDTFSLELVFIELTISYLICGIRLLEGVDVKFSFI